MEISQEDHYQKYQDIVIHLKKKRLLKRATILEAAEQLERLAGQCEPEIAGLCFRGAARCYAALGQPSDEANALLRAARCFARANANQHFNSLDDSLHLALLGYHECQERLEEDPSTGIMSTCLHFEIAKHVSDSESLTHIQKAAEKLKQYPTQHLHCLNKILLHRVKNEDFVEAFKVCKESLDVASKLAINEHLKQSLNISRVFLILLLEPKASQLAYDDAELMEKISFMELDERLENNSELECFENKILLSLQNLVAAFNCKNVHNFNCLRGALEELNEEVHLILLDYLADRITKGRIY